MKSILRVENFGPIKDAILDLRNVNVLIGPQASGKSTLAKLYTICKSPSFYHENKEVSLKLFFEKLEYFSISSFIRKDTVIEYNSSTHNFKFEKNKIFFKNELDKYFLNFEDDDNDFIQNLKGLYRLSSELELDVLIRLYLKSKNNSIEIDNFFKYKDSFIYSNLNDEEKRNIIKTVDFFKDSIFNSDALYVPAERAILNLLKQASFGFQLLKIAIPNHLLGYGNLFEIASKNISELNLNFLSKNTSYKFENGVDKIYFSKNENVKLSESASSFQSIIPLLLPIINEKENQNKQYSFVIEEPETNLFPKAQYELMKFLEKDRKDDFGMIDKGSIHTYTTHSPFILSSLNNMLYAYKMGLIDRKNKNIIEKISKIIPEENWIDPNTFSAYEIKNGKAKNIFDRKSGLIKENAIDLISEDIIEDFRKIAIATIE